MRIRKLGWILIVVAAVLAVLAYRAYSAEAAAGNGKHVTTARAVGQPTGRRLVDVPSDVPGQFATSWTYVKGFVPSGAGEGEGLPLSPKTRRGCAVFVLLLAIAAAAVLVWWFRLIEAIM